jgi:ATP-dependent Lhr-like helicase
MRQASRSTSPLAPFHPAVQAWFAQAFAAPTAAQEKGWPPLARGESTLLVAPTGSGKTLAAFLHGLDRMMFAPVPARGERCRIVYVSPLKALAVDVERNLRAPLAGVADVATGRGEPFHRPTISLRTGDTSPRERARFVREPGDILITTPESLYLILTSQARQGLRAVETVIVDEIHALVPGKRGAHLALSLERLEALRGQRIQRIGLSATARPLDEVAHFLGGVETPVFARRASAAASAVDSLMALDEPSRARPRFRPVTVVDAGSRKPLALHVEVPVEDMAALSRFEEIPSGPAARGAARPSIWAAIHPRLLELVRAHRSTLIFVNSRRIAERLAAAINELGGEVLAHAHHGSLAPAQRAEVEDRLKAGTIRALVATSSLELGIDMGALDLVVQIEAPPSVGSGLQRVGRAGHQVGATSEGILFPKYRADLLACAAVTRAMADGDVEATRYPRNPLDVLAQQVVAAVAMEPWPVDELYALVRRAAPYAALPRAAFDNVLDMLAGRYDSDDFAELRPRLTWDRAGGRLTIREGARLIAVTSGGTIPDRGLFAVYLVGAERRGGARVGELDEEMVFESRVGETFVLGASTWRIEEITHDRVLVSPAPGQPGKMPFWRGEAAGRTVELGRRVGALSRELRELPRSAGRALLIDRHGMSRGAAENLLAFLRDQLEASGAVPDDRTVVIERCRDELGDFRVCVLSPLGGRVHMPWAMAAAGKIRDQTGLDVEIMSTDDGFVARFPESDQPPDSALLLPAPEELEALLLRQLGGTAVFAARFREAAARALLLPRRNPARRAPLWHTRKRAADLLAVAARQGSFPMLLEAYRECLRDTFDLPALGEVMRGIKSGAIKVITVDSTTPSPFAGTLLFGFVANYIYDGDAPLPERRAQALAIDHVQLRELLGEAELRELIDPDALTAVESELQQPAERARLRTPDAVHDLLLRLGDLSLAELEHRTAAEGPAALRALLETRRAVEIPVAGERRFIAVEHASRYRDGMGAPLPPGLPEALLRPVTDAIGDLLLRHARTHGPFTAAEPAARLGLPLGRVESALARLLDADRILEGAFRPGGREREWCAPEVLGQLRRRSLARLRREVEPVPPAALARTITAWQGVVDRRRGLDAVLDVVEKLQGVPLPASLLESEILPARVEGYLPGDIDALASVGEVLWTGVAPLGSRDGRVALYLADALPRLWQPPTRDEGALDPREKQVIDVLRAAGASFFAPLHEAAGGGFPAETMAALWRLVFRGVITNDTFRALRAFTRPRARLRGATGGFAHRTEGHGFRSRRTAPAAADGRWSLVEARLAGRAAPSATERVTALAQQLLARYGIVTREVAAVEEIAGGFAGPYEAFKAMEAAGRIRRGYFVSGVAATQFAWPAALDLLRGRRHAPEVPEVLTLPALDPANPYGAILPWPITNPPGRLTRTVGAQVVLVDGALGGYLARGGRHLWIWLPEDEPQRQRMTTAVAARVGALADRAGTHGDGVLVTEIDGQRALDHPFAEALLGDGFVRTHAGLQRRGALARALAMAGTRSG